MHVVFLGFSYVITRFSIEFSHIFLQLWALIVSAYRRYTMLTDLDFTKTQLAVYAGILVLAVDSIK